MGKGPCRLSSNKVIKWLRQARSGHAQVNCEDYLPKEQTGIGLLQKYHNTLLLSLQNFA